MADAGKADQRQGPEGRATGGEGGRPPSTKTYQKRFHWHLTGSRLAVSVGAGALYLDTLAPGAGWLDTSEFIAGAHTLGVVHPPSHPLYLLLAKGLELLLPLGAIGFRVNLLSALLGVCCALLVCEIVRRIGAIVAGVESPADAWAGAGAGLLLAATEACWLQSVRAEVYTLNAALVLGGVLLSVHWWQHGGRATVLAMAVLCGLALCNHHYLVFFFLPAPLLLLLLRADGRRILASRTLLVAAGLVVAGLLTYAYVPVRAATDPAINWGDPTTASRFIDTLTARTFQGSVSADAREAGLGENVGTALSMFASQLGPVGLLAGALGLVGLLLTVRALGLLLLAALGLNVMTKAIMLIDPENPDDYGYFLLGVAILCVGAGVCGRLLAERAQSPAQGRWVAWLAAAALGAGSVTLATGARPKADLSRDHSAEAITDGALERVAPDSVILVNFYSVFFNYWYAQLVEERRPDVVLVQSTFDGKRYDGQPYVAALRRRHPVLEPVLAEFERTRHFPAASLLQLARRVPVYVEPMPEMLLEPTRLEAVGMVRRLETAPLRDHAAAAADHRYWDPMLQRLYGQGPPHAEAGKVLFWFHWIHAIAALRQGLGGTATGVLRRFAAIDDRAVFPDLAQLAERLSIAATAAAVSPASTRPFDVLRLEVRRAFSAEIDYLHFLSR